MDAESSSVRFSIDTGGTFTDIVVLDESTGRFAMDKVATTPHDTLEGVLAAIEKAEVDLSKVKHFFVHGSTTALNAMLERKGVKTAFITTRGFRDVPEIMRYNRPEMYNPKYRKPTPVAPRELRFEVTERVDVDGEVLAPLDEAEAREVAEKVRGSGAAAVAVCFIHAYRNPAHERRMREILREVCPEVSVAISSSVAPEHREFERGMTTILNAYLAPVVERWIGDLQRELKRRGFEREIVLTKSDGGGMTAETARGSPINMLLSGPAGGVIGGLHLSRITDYPNLITMDVGGTSFDVAMIKNRTASVQQETRVNGYPLLISNLDIRTIGAGGGSIAWIDEGGALHVGPQSAGARPGPIAYGRGGDQPTVTDAFLVNNLVDRENFLGGGMTIDFEGAERGIRERIAAPLGLEPIQASSGILRIAMANMAEAVKDIASETGDDVRDFAMLCFGGGGALFGGFLMDDLSLPAIIVPIVPSTFSAFGMLMVDLRHDLVRTVSKPLASLTSEALDQAFGELEAEGMDLLAREGVGEDSREAVRLAEMRYSGQEHAVTVPVDFDLGEGGAARLYEAFRTTYRGVYGYDMESPADVVTLRVKAVGKISKPEIRDIPAGDGSAAQARKGRRRAYDFLSNDWQDFAVYDREKLLRNDRIPGPALIEEATTTTVVRDGQECVVDRFGNLIVTRA